ncbi:MAG: Lrp/AsnC family transcriptional regulator [Nitrosopumilaceae archaeon]|nr:Lrp/AsnC family transcriptional regulator [Nitrosopumilaceae archaeon]NDB87337.1 Lrp/AsnC family transcriptional regulator [Nitrososphaerota archaeon]NDB91564.1 Lrp/AsnC family transcriptional regulator [Nitrososphaeria archaeon]NDB63126.1 Lrp/AsnC family transcriptional regulator [Nitrosopumilaceae archaeon]NDB89235.1 Lrp/AsnC family transcriptional regulator [Nitrososphaerota archaeon]
MDSLDKEILNEIQWSFPLVAEPYKALAEKFHITHEEMKNRITNLKSAGVLRQLSAIFDTRRLGYKSSLVAMAILPDKLDYVANQINRHPGVSHNYERNHEYNLWFTLATPPGSDLKTEVDKFSKLPGILKVRLLPTIKLFKIGVKLDMVDDKKKEIAPTEEKKKINDIKFTPTEDDKEFIRHLQKDLPVVDRPFLASANALGMTESQVFEKLQYYEEIGVMRRYAAILRHRDVGFTANGMIVWKVPEDRIEPVGEKLGAFPQISHCYQRPVYADWPYNVFSMVHCKSVAEAEDMAKDIQKHIQVDDYRILFSSREFKKTRVEYFTESEFTVENPITA